jgi:hypothetical protein
MGTTFKAWFKGKIPSGSTLELTVEPQTPVAYSVLVKIDGKPTWQTPDFKPSSGHTKTKKLTGVGKVFVVETQLVFSGNSTVRVKGSIEKPGGGTFGSTFDETLSGKNGDIATVMFYLEMVKS